MKGNRRKKILDLIQTYRIDTQEELVRRLRESGYDVTQATVSRDIKILNITKVLDDTGKQRYTLLPVKEDGLRQKHIRVLQEGFLSMNASGNILVIKTISGMAMAVCAAIDGMEWEEIIGSVAGDDTILCVIQREDLMSSVMRKLKELV